MGIFVKKRQCTVAGCRAAAGPVLACPVHEALSKQTQLLLEAEQRGFHDGVRAAADDIQALAERWGAVPRHILVQVARSWLEETDRQSKEP